MQLFVGMLQFKMIIIVKQIFMFSMAKWLSNIGIGILNESKYKLIALIQIIIDGYLWLVAVTTPLMWHFIACIEEISN